MHSLNTNNKKIAKNTIALYIRMAITMFISFFTTRITLEILGVEDYGLNNLVSSVVALFSFLNGSMGTAIQRFYSFEIGKGNENKLGYIFGSGLSLHLIVAIISILFMEIFAIFFLHKLNIPDNRLFAAQVVFQISIVSMGLNILSVPYTALLRAKEEFSKIAIADVMQSIGRLIVVYLLLNIDYDHLIILGVLNFLITLLYITFIIYIARYYKECRHSICWDIDIIKNIAKFISMLIVTVLASLFRDKGIIILVNMFFGLTVNAAYAVAMQIMHIVGTFVMNFKQSVVPQIMISYGKNDLNRMHNLINVGTKITFILMLIITLPIIFEGNYILTLWLKEPPQYSYELMCLSLININISSFTYFLYQGVHATGNITKQQTYISISYFLNIVVIYIAFKIGLNFYSALIISIIFSIIQCFFNIYFAYVYFNYNIKKFTIITLKCVICFIFTMFVLYIINNNIQESIFRIIITTLATIFSSTLIGYFIILDNKEKDYCKGLINKRKRQIYYEQ
ncbi:MAG: hypothetical protein IJB61_07050 [Bacteroides sp]|nr:hypothetical protein [Bacteroides sp.]